MPKSKMRVTKKIDSRIRSEFYDFGHLNNIYIGDINNKSDKDNTKNDEDAIAALNNLLNETEYETSDDIKKKLAALKNKQLHYDKDADEDNLAKRIFAELELARLSKVIKDDNVIKHLNDFYTRDKVIEQLSENKNKVNNLIEIITKGTDEDKLREAFLGIGVKLDENPSFVRSTIEKNKENAKHQAQENIFDEPQANVLDEKETKSNIVNDLSDRIFAELETTRNLEYFNNLGCTKLATLLSTKGILDEVSAFTHTLQNQNSTKDVNNLVDNILNATKTDQLVTALNAVGIHEINNVDEILNEILQTQQSINEVLNELDKKPEDKTTPLAATKKSHKKEALPTPSKQKHKKKKVKMDERIRDEWEGLLGAFKNIKVKDVNDINNIFHQPSANKNDIETQIEMLKENGKLTLTSAFDTFPDLTNRIFAELELTRITNDLKKRNYKNLADQLNDTFEKEDVIKALKEKSSSEEINAIVEKIIASKGEDELDANLKEIGLNLHEYDIKEMMEEINEVNKQAKDLRESPNIELTNTSDTKTTLEELVKPVENVEPLEDRYNDFLNHAETDQRSHLTKAMKDKNRVENVKRKLGSMTENQAMEKYSAIESAESKESVRNALRDIGITNKKTAKAILGESRYIILKPILNPEDKPETNTLIEEKKQALQSRLRKLSNAEWQQLITKFEHGEEPNDLKHFVEMFSDDKAHRTEILEAFSKTSQLKSLFEDGGMFKDKKKEQPKKQVDYESLLAGLKNLELEADTGDIPKSEKKKPGKHKKPHTGKSKSKVSLEPIDTLVSVTAVVTPITKLGVQKALGDGNCAFNAFVLGLAQDDVLNHLEKIQGEIPEFLAAAAEKLKVNNSFQEIKKEIIRLREGTEKDREQLQTELAPIIRNLSYIISIESNPDDTSREALKAAFTDAFFASPDIKIPTHGVSDDKYNHDFIKDKFAEIINAHKSNFDHEEYLRLDKDNKPEADNMLNNFLLAPHEELLTWWKNEGYGLFLATMSEDYKWAGDSELLPVANRFKLGLIIIPEKATKAIKHGGLNGILPAEAIQGLDSQAIEQLKDRGIVEDKNGQLYFLPDMRKEEVNALLGGISIEHTDQVSNYLTDNDIAKNDTVPKEWSPDCIKELVNLGVINKNNTGDGYVFSLNDDDAIKRIAPLDDQEKILAAWDENYKTTPVITVEHVNSNHYNYVQSRTPSIEPELSVEEVEESTEENDYAFIRNFGSGTKAGSLSGGDTDSSFDSSSDSNSDVSDSESSSSEEDVDTEFEYNRIRAHFPNLIPELDNEKLKLIELFNKKAVTSKDDVDLLLQYIYDPELSILINNFKEVSISEEFAKKYFAHNLFGLLIYESKSNLQQRSLLENHSASIINVLHDRGIENKAAAYANLKDILLAAGVPEEDIYNANFPGISRIIPTVRAPNNFQGMLGYISGSVYSYPSVHPDLKAFLVNLDSDINAANALYPALDTMNSSNPELADVNTIYHLIDPATCDAITLPVGRGDDYDNDKRKYIAHLIFAEYQFNRILNDPDNVNFRALLSINISALTNRFSDSLQTPNSINNFLDQDKPNPELNDLITKFSSAIPPINKDLARHFFANNLFKQLKNDFSGQPDKLRLLTDNEDAIKLLFFDERVANKVAAINIFASNDAALRAARITDTVIAEFITHFSPPPRPVVPVPVAPALDALLQRLKVFMRNHPDFSNLTAGDKAAFANLLTEINNNTQLSAKHILREKIRPSGAPIANQNDYNELKNKLKNLDKFAEQFHPDLKQREHFEFLVGSKGRDIENLHHFTSGLLHKVAMLMGNELERNDPKNNAKRLKYIEECKELRDKLEVLLAKTTTEKPTVQAQINALNKGIAALEKGTAFDKILAYAEDVDVKHKDLSAFATKEDKMREINRLLAKDSGRPAATTTTNIAASNGVLSTVTAPIIKEDPYAMETKGTDTSKLTRGPVEIYYIDPAKKAAYESYCLAKGIAAQYEDAPNNNIPIVKIRIGTVTMEDTHMGIAGIGDVAQFLLDKELDKLAVRFVDRTYNSRTEADRGKGMVLGKLTDQRFAASVIGYCRFSKAEYVEPRYGNYAPGKFPIDKNEEKRIKANLSDPDTIEKITGNRNAVLLKGHKPQVRKDDIEVKRGLFRRGW